MSSATVYLCDPMKLKFKPIRIQLDNHCGFKCANEYFNDHATDGVNLQVRQGIGKCPLLDELSFPLSFFLVPFLISGRNEDRVRGGEGGGGEGGRGGRGGGGGGGGGEGDVLSEYVGQYMILHCGLSGRAM